MTLLQLRYYQAVCQFNSVSKAAEALHISQPAISLAIKDLEEEFHVSLFTRKNKRLIPTPEGVFFLDQITPILTQLDSLNDLMTDLGKKSRSLDIGMISMSWSNLFWDSLHRFRSLYPNVRISIHECGSEKALENVRNGVYSSAVIIVDDKQKYFSLDGLVLRRTEYVFCVNEKHPLAALAHCTPDQLKDQSIILFQEETFLTKQIKKYFYQLGVTPNILMYTMNYPLIQSLLTNGKDGVFLTREVASQFSDVVQIPLDQPIEIAYALVWKKRENLNSDFSKLLEIVREDYPNAELLSQP